MTGITHGYNKFALNSTSSFALLVECATTHDRTVPNCGWPEGWKGLVDESMEEEGCRGTVRREIVEDKDSEGVREGEGPPSREEGRKCWVFLRKGWGEVNRKGDRQSETTSQTCSLWHIVHQNEQWLQRYSFVHFIYLFAKNGHWTV